MTSRTAAATTKTTGARRRLKLLLIVLILFMSWAVYVLVAQYGQMSERSDQLKEANRKLSEAQAKNEELKQQIARLDDDEYIGQIARKEYGLGRPGEVPIEMK